MTQINARDSHKPVLLNEAIEKLITRANGIYVDATFGRGGHSVAILKALSPEGRLFAMDRDPEAAQAAQAIEDPRFQFRHTAFSELLDWMTGCNLVGKIEGVLFDLGVSSPQLDSPERGFSFLQDGPLDMRMDPSRGLDAATWINQASQEEIADVLFHYGEERFARRIARAIVETRVNEPILRTRQLAKLIEQVYPGRRERHKHPATRTFQAIRIFINRELEELEQALNQTLEVLRVGGRLVVISFHSLEDRKVKQFIRHYEKGEPLPRGLPVIPENWPKPRLKQIGKPIYPNSDEVKQNPRARSAIMRIAEKCM